MENLSDKLVLVLGLGETGLSMVRWLSVRGARLRVADSRVAPPGLSEVARLVGEGEVCCGPFTDALFEGVDLIAISPGVALADPMVARAVARGIPAVGDIELFAWQNAGREKGEAGREKGQGEAEGLPFPLPSSPFPAKILAITGANGKTTVTSMVEHLCRAVGRDALAAGNISPAVLDAAMQRGDRQPEIWVLELSSFQLETTSTLHADAATVLNISEDHLDRYDGMDAYAAAKQRIFMGCGVQVLNRDDARSRAMADAAAHRVVTFGLDAPVGERDFGIGRDGDDVWLMQGAQRLMKAAELQLNGLHNVANALAALALCDAIGLPMTPLLAGLKTFKGLPHRVERVCELNGVVYFDDSKGTNVGATVAALEGLGRPAVLILGGVGKDQDFSPLKPAVARHARAVVLIGRDAPLIEAALAGCGVAIHHAADMRLAVNRAAKLAQAGDAVLLSPACASFDMFRNYAHRAEVFVAAVKMLEKEGAWSR